MERVIIVDCRADDKTIKSLKKTGCTVIPTLKLDCLYDAIASHADIQIHYLGNNRFVCAPEAYEHYKKHLSDNFTLIKGSMPLGSKYPQDIPYNAAIVCNTLICNPHFTAAEILSEYSCSNRNIISVAQGYAKCSVCVVDKNAIITSDKGIAKSAMKGNIDVLEITEGCIKLRYMKYGFIGGATGLIDKETLAVNGELSTHPDCQKIMDFCNQHGVNIIELNNGDLVDIGSVITNFDF